MEEKSAAATTGGGPGQQTAEEIARETRDMLRRHCEEQRARDQLRDLKLESLDIQVTILGVAMMVVGLTGVLL